MEKLSTTPTGMVIGGLSFYFTAFTMLKTISSLLNFLLIELLQSWSEFQEKFYTERDWKNIWNNKEMRKKVLSKYVFLNDLLFELNSTDSFIIISNKSNQ